MNNLSYNDYTTDYRVYEKVIEIGRDLAYYFIYRTISFTDEKTMNEMKMAGGNRNK